MTTQISDSLVRDGKRTGLRNLPLETFWEDNPPRPYLVLISSGAYRGYTATWEISNEELYLTDFETEGAFKTSKNYLGDDELDKLWRIARRDPSVGTVKSVMGKLAELAFTESACVKRSAQIVNDLGERLLSRGELKPRTPGRELYKAAQMNSRAGFSNEIIPVTVETLFPGSNGRAFAAWYSGVLRIGEGESENVAFTSTYERTRLIECRAGCIVGETVEKSPNYPLNRVTQPPLERTPEMYIQEAVQLGAGFWGAVKAWGEGVDLWTDEEQRVLGLACREKFIPSPPQAFRLWALRLQAEKDGCRIELLHSPTMHLLD